MTGRCKEQVSTKGTFRFHQCTRPNGHGPKGLYCKQHDPDVRQAKREVRDAKWREEWDKQARSDKFTKAARQAIRDIAAGHNDARGLAIKILKEFEG